MDRFDNMPEIALDWVRAGRKVALATVVQTWGSAPRRVGRRDEHLEVCEGGSVDPGDPVDGVLQQRGERPVVLGGHQHQDVRRGHLAGERRSGSGDTVADLEIAVVEREWVVAEVDDLDLCVGVDPVDDAPCQRLVDRTGAGAGRHDQDLAGVGG